MSDITNENACPPIDCNNFDPVDLQPYPDISGNGVLVGFIGTAYLVLLLVVASYCLAFDPNKEPFEDQVTPAGSTSDACWRPNTIDQLFVTWVQKMPRLTSDTRARLRSAFDESIIMLCDVQILTGLGILCSSYMLLPCGLDASHWQIAIYLAWFSTVTHMSGLTVLRTYLNAYRWAKYFRVILMFALLILLIVGLIPTGFFSKDHPASQAICYFDANHAYRRFEIENAHTYNSEMPRVEESESWQAMVFSVILLISGFLTRSVKLFRPLSTAFRLRIRQPLSGWTQRILRRLGQSRTPSSHGETLKSRLVTKPAIAVFLMARLNCDLFSSMFFEVYWLLAILLWGTVKLFGARNAIISTNKDVAASENRWTFGQILPVFLLFGPLFSITGILVYHITNKPLPTSYHSGSMDQMAISNIIPLRQQHHISEQSTESRVLSDLLQNLDPSQDNPRNTSAASARPATYSTRGDFSYVENFSGAPWLPICVFSSFSAILLGTVTLFGTTFNFYSSFESQFSLYEVWISEFNGLFFLLVTYPCACATTIGFGLGMELRNSWRKTGFYWLCILVYGVPLSLTYSTFITETGGLWTKVGPYMGLVVSLILYLFYIVFSLITI